MPKPTLRRCRNVYHCRRHLPPTVRRDARFCSDACRAQRYRESARPGGAPRQCEQCGDVVTLNQRSDARYCSARCRQRAYVARRSRNA